MNKRPPMPKPSALKIKKDVNIDEQIDMIRESNVSVETKNLMIINLAKELNGDNPDEFFKLWRSLTPRSEA